MTTWTSLIDLQYEQALHAGAFDRVNGRGQPLRLRDNPFEGEWRLAHHVVRSRGCTLPWIEERNELLALIETARTWLRDAARRYEAAPGEIDTWQRQVNLFGTQIATLNQRIVAYNLRAPALSVQIAPLHEPSELQRALPHPPRSMVAFPVAPLPAALPTSYAGLLTTYLAPQWRRVALMSALLLVSIALEVLNPQILRAFIDTARAGGSSAALANAALLFLAAVIIGQLVSACASYTSADVGYVATNGLRADLLHHCLRLDLRFHHQHTPGALIERIEGDVTALAHFFSQFIIQVVGNSILLCGILAVLFREDWRVGLTLTAFVVGATWMLRRFHGIAVPAIKAARTASSDLTSFWEERLVATEDLRPNGATRFTLAQLDGLLATLLRRMRADRMWFRASVALWAVLLAVGNALAFAVGAWLYGRGAITLGTVYMIVAYTGLLGWNLGRITDHVNELQRAVASVGRIKELAQTHSVIVDGGGVPLPAGPLAVAFRNVTFGYSDDVPVLRTMSFDLAAGEILGVIGRTGSGKSTLGRLVFRFYDPQAGTIALNDVDIRDLRVADLRQRVALVTQHVQLVSGSVRDNLTLFDDRISDEQIVAVLARLGLGPWLERLPDGLASVVRGSGGVSAGEAQLLAFARVFLRNPSIVMLDEASAHLDPASQQLVERAIDHLLRGRTAIIIAHRLETLRRADRILLLDDGQVVEYGTRTQLAADPQSHYARLLRVATDEVLP